MTVVSLAAIVAGLIIAFLLLKFLTGMLIKTLVVLIVVAILIYFLFIWNGGLVNYGKKEFILYELQDKYCAEKVDTIKCECIVNPLIADFHKKYTPEQISEFQRDRIKSVELVLKLLNDNKSEIRVCLKKKNALHAWDDFVKDIKSFELGKKFRKLIDNFQKSE